jgi:hypothetical protein
MLVARPPASEQDGEVGPIHDAIAVDVACSAGALPPLREHDAEIGAVDHAVEDIEAYLKRSRIGGKGA